MKRLFQNLLIGLILILCISCNRYNNPLKLSLLISGQSNYDYYDSLNNKVAIDSNFFTSNWNSEITNLLKFKKSNKFNSINRADTLIVSENKLLDEKTDTFTRKYIVNSYLTVESINTDNRRVTIDQKRIFMTINGYSNHEVLLISNDKDSSSYKLETNFKVDFIDSGSDKLSKKMINYIIDKSFIDNYISSINKKLTEKYK